MPPPSPLTGDLHVERVAVQDAAERTHRGEALAALAVVLAVDQPDGEAVVPLGGTFLGGGEGALIALLATAVQSPRLSCTRIDFSRFLSILVWLTCRCSGSFAPGRLLPGQEGKVRSGRSVQGVVDELPRVS